MDTINIYIFKMAADKSKMADLQYTFCCFSHRTKHFSDRKTTFEMNRYYLRNMSNMMNMIIFKMAADNSKMAD